MRAIEQAAIESGEVTGLELMERAGQGVVEAIFEEWPELDTPGKRAVALCGPGNNGGDGFVVARLLKERGWEVQVFLYGDPAKLPPDAKVNYERWSESGLSVLPLTVEETSKRNSFDLRVDALFGTGLTRHLPKDLLEAVYDLNRGADGSFVSPCPKRVAVDCPSGLDLDSGRVLGPPGMWSGDVTMDLFSDLTVSFHAPKLGHFIDDGPGFCRKVVVKSIGIEREFGLRNIGYFKVNSRRKQADRGRVVEHLQALRFSTEEYGWSPLYKDTDDHKFSHGHALILTGGSGKTGAARLSARAALRIGAGLVTLGVPPSAQQEVACQITALMLQRVADAEALTEVLKDSRLNALCLGPGMGLDRARDLVPAALAAKRATVLDADALSAFWDAPEELFSMLHENCVLTPHGGEFARLFPDIAEKLNAPAIKGPAYSKVDATREAAARAGCVVLFKGADTVIAAPNGRCSVNAAHYDRAAPWLATAGSGDVLAGFITGLLARGFAPMQAAESAAWLHVDCALEFGPGLIAEDLPEQIPAVFRKLGF
jgi:hydroxyethylthiazole kinase-like uncharacterized protein yjeF